MFRPKFKRFPTRLIVRRPPRPKPPAGPDVGFLRRQVEDSSKANRSLLMAYLGFMTYMLITVASTTDMMLLTNAPVKLPLVNIELPLFSFYIAVPLFILAVHFFMLVNQLQHMEKLAAWVNADEEADRRRMFPYIFNMVAFGRHGIDQKLILSLRWTLLVLLPLFLALFLQRRFSTYHSLGMTIWHFLCSLADVGSSFFSGIAYE